MRVFPVAALGLGGALLGRATSCQGAGDACIVDLVEPDENLLLQHQRSAGAKREKPVALALSGGGFLAHSSLSGIFAALLSFTSIQDLFKHVEAISVASAGGWFIGQLAFSPHFLNLIQTMGNEPHKAGELYQKEWVWKFLVSLAVGRRPAKRSADEIERAQAEIEALRADKSLWGVDEDFVELLVEFYWVTSDGEDRTWEELIGDLMAATAGGEITGATTLGSPVNTWAEGKNFLIGTSITTPGDTGPGSCNDRDASGWFCVGPRVPQALIYRNYSAFVAYSSRAEGVDALPIAVWSPARFSVKMGSGPNQQPPMSFCHSCDGLEVTYKSTVDPRGASRMVDSFHYNSNTPLVGAVAAGSAFLGELVVLPFFDAQYFKLAAEKIADLVEKIPSWAAASETGWKPNSSMP